MAYIGVDDISAEDFKAPEGKYRIIGTFGGTHIRFIVRDEDTLKEAMDGRDECYKGCGYMHSFAVYDDQGRYIERYPESCSVTSGEGRGVLVLG